MDMELNYYISMTIDWQKCIYFETKVKGDVIYVVFKENKLP